MTKQKIILVYIGNEQGSWGAISYPKPAHYYVMPGILYCAKVLESDSWINENFEIHCHYFNSTVQTHAEMLSDILACNADCVGFSVYCWNVAFSLALIREIKKSAPKTRIIAGGPELSMKKSEECMDFFGHNPDIDLLVFGEAETKLPALIAALFDKTALPAHLTGYSFSPTIGGAGEFTKGYTLDPSDIPSIYPFTVNIKRSDSCGLAMVYETGRGCPYKCIYCHFSHRNHKPYRYDITRVERELQWLFEQNFDCIHFADAVFDLDISYAKAILVVCKKYNNATSLFFYCSFYKMDEELAALFCESQAQICVGIQSTNHDVLAKINRALSPRLFSDIKDILAKYPINFYVDLIFGLPNDSMESFKTSVADSLKLSPSFIMVFPLTLIKGTPLEINAHAYGMHALENDSMNVLDLKCEIEYKNIALYKAFSLDDLVEFDDIALALFYFYTRFRKSLDYLEKRCDSDTGALYRRIGQKTKSFLQTRGIVATNTNFIEGFEDQIKAIFLSEASMAGALAREIAAFEEIFKLDIYRILMMNSPNRQKLFKNGKTLRQATIPITPQTRIVRIAPGKAIQIPFLLTDLLSLAGIRDSIPQKGDTVFVCAPFTRWEVLLFSISLLEKFLLDAIPTDRAVKFGQLMQSVLRGFHDTENNADREHQVLDILTVFRQQGIISFWNPVVEK